jgi:hypothetical protein
MQRVNPERTPGTSTHPRKSGVNVPFDPMMVHHRANDHG